MGPIVLFETSRVRLIEYSRFRDSTVLFFSLFFKVCELMKMELIPQSVIQLLWQKFALKFPETTREEQKAAIVILSMIAGAEKDIIKSNLSVLIEHGLTKTHNNYLLARDTCSAILKLTLKTNKFETDSSKEVFRLPSDHNLFTKLELMVVEGLTNIEDMSWTPFCEQALTIIYQLAESPDLICARIIKCLVRIMMEDTKNGDNTTLTEDNVAGEANDTIKEQDKQEGTKLLYEI